MDDRERWQHFAKWLRWYAEQQPLLFTETKDALRAAADAAEMIANDVEAT
jgi:hypothetical protein